VTPRAGRQSGDGRFPWRAVLVLAVAAVFGACAGPAGPTRAVLEQRAAAAGFMRQRLDAGDMTLVGWIGPDRAPVGAASGHLAVFIEGDGAAWPDRDRPPADPTPRHTVALDLAVASRLPHVAALARPCQYERAAACRVSDWTVDRFSPQAVARMDTALDDLKHQTGAETLVLVGYSGGAFLAARLAVARADVRGLVTVAGVIDPAAWTRHHRVTALPGLDPRTARRLARLPQAHLLGENDRIVPPAWARGVLEHHGLGAPTHRVSVLEGQAHACCWGTAWPALERDLGDVLSPEWGRSVEE